MVNMHLEPRDFSRISGFQVLYDLDPCFIHVPCLSFEDCHLLILKLVILKHFAFPIVLTFFSPHPE